MTKSERQAFGEWLTHISAADSYVLHEEQGRIAFTSGERGIEIQFSIIDRLEAEELLQMEQEGDNQTVISLTDKGKALLEKFRRSNPYFKPFTQR